ncbi:MAG TPA: zinc ribbon domain-containing protein, partial [Gemmatimonadales bacterium]|nr:zinc ribbon domain-containing protein [Gemmatimonadales bacterium]
PSRQLDFPPSMNCQACGTALAATAKFCHKCGARVSAQVSAGQAAGWRAGVPWGVAGAAVGALVTVLALRLGGSTGRGTGDAGGVGDGPLPSSPVPPPDISQMSPEERATRLYNRVMSLHSQGQADSAEFFLPMALQAYAMLPALDVDARYHIGVLDLTGGNAAGALAQADTIRRATPTHLFGFMLRARALELTHDAAGALRAYRAFLQNEAAERARQRPEYGEHAQNLDAFRDQAKQVTAGKATRGS